MHLGSRLGATAALLMMGWLSVVLAVDHGGTLPTQRLLGAATWLVLVVALQRTTPLVRTQTLVVVAFATVVEYTFSPGLEVYVYRFDNVPAYVPPGHGLVYLSAFALGHAPFVRRRLRAAVWVVTVPLVLWAAYGLFLADRHDALGGLWLLCLLAFLRWGPSTEVYVGAAVVVTWLELLGTHLRTWVWQPVDPVGWLSIGNPPSGAAGGYGWFDLVALAVAPTLLGWWTGVRGRAVETPASSTPAAPTQDAVAS
ncbi:MAG TPA: hypothetical protein VFG72_05030 [Marmoricola sp.]|nr:hypothetical protein [Marmoricola sp.]